MTYEQNDTRPFKTDPFGIFLLIFAGLSLVSVIGIVTMLATGHSFDKVETATIVSTTTESHEFDKTKYIVVVRNDKTGDVKTLADTRPVNSAYKEGDHVAVDYVGAAPQTIQ